MAQRLQRVRAAPHRQARYASPEGLGQTFNFDLLQADFCANEFHEIISRNLAASEAIGGSTTWVLSNHDVVRHATRYGLPGGQESKGAPGARAPAGTGNNGKLWLFDGGNPAQVDQAQGPRRARAATMFLLGLPGSAYLYQGEELELPEVGQIPDEDRQDPAFFRNRDVEVGRDGCRGAAGVARSDSATTALTCRSRTGSATTPSRFRMQTPPPF